MSDETEITLEGAGVLGGTTWGPKARARHEAEREVERKLEAEAENYAAELQSQCDEIDALMAPHLRGQLAAENQVSRISETNKTDFNAFRRCCEEWQLPALPAPPQAVAVFLPQENARGYAHLKRLCRSVSTVHLAANALDPTTDILVRSLLRQAHDEAKSKPQTKKDDLNG